METIRTTYEPMKAQAERKVLCPECGKNRTIRRTFTMTVNPFNKNDDGTVRTRTEVQDAVRAKAAAWEPSAYDSYHQKCWEERS